MKYYPINEEAARTAWQMNHFGEFRSDEAGYRASVDEAYALAETAAEARPEQKERALALADRYARKLADWTNKKYRIDSMCPSVLISGSGNFPVRKKEKQNRAIDAHWQEYEKLKAMKESIGRLGDESSIIKSGDADAIEQLRKKLDGLTAKHQRMKDANAKARKEGKPAPYAPYALSNSNQNIRATRQRLERLQTAKEKGTSAQHIEFMGESVEVIETAEAMRLQLVFTGKSAEDVRTTLKKHGFKWSPKNSAWQRQLTDNARFALRQMLKTATS